MVVQLIYRNVVTVNETKIIYKYLKIDEKL